MTRKAIVYGLLAGIIVSVIMVISMATSSQEMEGGVGMLIKGYAGMLICFSMIFGGVRSYRNHEGGGYISFGRAFGLGAIIALIASVMYVITWMLYSHFFMADFADKYAAAMLAKAQAANLDAAKMAAKVKEIDDFKAMYQKPVMVAIMTLMEILPVGVVMALISAGVYTKKVRVK